MPFFKKNAFNLYVTNIKLDFIEVFSYIFSYIKSWVLNISK